MKATLQRFGLLPVKVFEYYTAEVVEPRVIDGQECHVRRYEMRQASWVRWLFVKWRKRDTVLHQAW